ncbi:MAG: phosphoglyceromutase [Acidobacteria bacterium]|nr:phosphoglyceromutase [Acidobacteriota bacterium]
MKPIVLALMLLVFVCPAPARTKTENVIVVTLDGARIQEIFGGLDEQLYKKIYKNAESRLTFKQYSAPNATSRREKLMPFFWTRLMRDFGSIAGNRELGSEVKTTNNLLFSYPGYSEILTGRARDVINSNDRIQNRFPSFLQFLQRKMRLNHDQVALFASWNVFNEIAATDKDAFEINAGYERFDTGGKALSDAQFETPTPWDSVRHDFYTFRFAMSHLTKHSPRVLYIGLGETDDWAHDENYDRMIDALRRSDNYLKELWEFVGTDPRYKDKTSVIITVDHGRGKTENDWDKHGEDVPEARWIWMAFASPDSKLRGEWSKSDTIYQNQVAATVTKLLGFDYSEQDPSAGRPIDRIFSN